MSLLDWILALLPLVVVAIAGLYARQYVRSVADFVSANRSARRYLLCIAGGELQAGAAVFVGAFEIFSHSGFAYGWWNAIGTPVFLFLTIIGFVGFRLRETRAMTLAQFFEIRYNKSFRVYTGILGFLAGIFNFGVIPAVGARAMVYFLGFPEHVQVLSHAIPTYVLLMALFLSVTVFVALTGGLITVMVINTLEGIMSQLFYLVIIAAILWMFSWSQMHDVLLDKPPGHSMVNPFDTSGVKDFNIWNVLMSILILTYGRGAWQNAAGYGGSALTPHEGRMGGIITSFREMGKGAVVTFLALAAVTFLHHPAFAAGAAHVHELVSQISNKQEQEQMEAPIALATLLPIGVKGIFCAILFMGIFGGDATHLHSWGSIFVQDILVPLRKEPFGPRTHLFVLRCAIVGVATFAFTFGALFHLADYINMWWGVTQALFTTGAGAAILGGLYWKKGTAAGAWAAFTTGFGLCTVGIVLQQIYAHYGEGFIANHTHLGFIELSRFAIEKDNHVVFAYNGTQISFFTSLFTAGVYIVVSLLTCKEDFNLDRMLHRGEYASIKKLVGDTPLLVKGKVHWGRLIGIDENFTPGDKWITGFLFSWQMFWFCVFVVGTIWNLLAPWQTETWASYYHVTGFTFPIFWAVVVGIWFTWGGLRDMRDLFRRLRGEHLNALDDGTVVNNQNLDEMVVEEKLHEAEDKTKPQL